jgi:hypothetical protein
VIYRVEVVSHIHTDCAAVKPVGLWYPRLVEESVCFLNELSIAAGQVATRKDLIAQQSFEDPENCSTQYQPAETVAVVERPPDLVT